MASASTWPLKEEPKTEAHLGFGKRDRASALMRRKPSARRRAPGA